MAVQISADDCIACSACVGDCPQEALTVDGVCEVDEDACVECGICVDSCPVGAITL